MTTPTTPIGTPLVLFTDPTATPAPAEPTLRDLAATLITIRDAAEHLLTTLTDAARATAAFAAAAEHDEDGDANLDPSCAANRHWFTYYGKQGSSSPTCVRPGCEVPNARYNPVNDAYLSDEDLAAAIAERRRAAARGEGAA